MGADEELASAKMTQSREALRQLIAQWNANRLDLFEISEPNDDGEFHGVMRFYFQEAGAKVATKCIRVASSATAKAVIETLVEKFRPDMRMLSIPQYALYEIHENGDERKLDESERPLLVQLNWHSDDREGRFLLRRIDEKVRYDFSMNKVVDVGAPMGDGFKRKLSKREKKQLKKLQEKEKIEAKAATAAEKLYTELPETSFTRSISNPEAVMRRRRQQKLEKKLEQFRSRDGGPDSGGTLKIYGESLCRDVPYKTLLLSVNDTAAYVVKEMLAKYALTNYDPQQYCLVQVCEGEGEYILDDDESPLSIITNQPKERGSIMFHVRRRPPDYHPRKRKKKQGRRADDELGGYRGSYDGQMEPLLVELLPDGSETGRRIGLESEVTEVGSDWGGLQLAGLKPHHCVIANNDGIVALTPSSRDADIYVNGQRVYETTLLQHGTIIRFGRTHYFRFAQRGRPFSEREVTDAPSAQSQQLQQQLTPVGGPPTLPAASISQSPPMSPTSEDVPRIRADSILPATLELPEAGEEGFLAGIILNVQPATLQFKLAPTYALYLAARYRATTHFRPEATPHERAHMLSTFLLRVAHILMQVVQERNTDPNALAFWMANSSELLHFLKSDRQIGAFSLDAQDVLAEVVQLSFRYLVTSIQGELANLVGLFMLERDNEDENATAPILGVLGTSMTLLRRCRVNAALTIQLFSQLFHFINMAIFNKIIGMDGNNNCCSRQWGNRLRRRLNRIETWAEKQGLELAADCHLVRVVQAAHLLQSPKNSPDELATAASSCFKLNSLQLRCLLMKYQYETDEVPVPPEVLDNIVRVAESTVDEVIRTDGRHVRVEEEPLLGLAFLLPEDGYSCDIVRGVPAGLIEFLTPLAPLCRLTPNPSAAGYWTIFFHDPMRSPSAMSGRSFAAGFNSGGAPANYQQQAQPGMSSVASMHSLMNASAAGETNVNGPHTPIMTNGGLRPPGSTSMSQQQQEPEIQSLKLKKLNSGLGLSIVAAKGVGQERLGIYIKSVVPGGSADMDGRLSAGDQLLTVDGQSLVGITQEKAAEYLVRTGQIVTLEVAKQAAIYQGLATMLSQPSPVLTRGGQPRRMSERDLPSKVMREQGQEVLEAHHIPHGGVMQPRMQSSKSVPSLNSDADRPIPASASMGFPATAGGMNGHATMVPPGVRSPGSYAHQQQIQHPNYSHQQQLDPNLSPRYPPQQGQQGYHPGMSMTMQPQGAARQLQYNQQQQQYPGGGPEHVNHLRSKSIQSLADPPHRPDIGSKQPSTPALNMQAQESERFYQNVGYYPQQQQQQGQAGNIPLRTYIPYSNSVGNIPPNAGFANAASMPAFRPGMQQQQQFRGPAGAPNPNMWRNSASQIQPGMNVAMQRDLMRQEAKMLEMQDELRRREERAALMMNKAAQQERQQQNRYNAQFTYTPGQQVGPQMLQQARERMNSGGGQAAFAPSVPTKPFRPDSMHDEGPGRPPLPDGYRYSTGDLPRGIGVLPYTNGVHGKQVQGTNPWERAEKEREAARRKEAARQWREQQIMELESLSNRNAPQEEQLRGLKLEREFQRRAEEMRRDDDGEGEEEEEEDDDRKNMVRRVQEDVERMRISGGAATAIANLPNGTKDPMNEERARKIEEMRRKKLELEAAQAAEERLVREATKRREEEFRRQQSQQHLQQQQAQMQAQQQQQHQSYQLQSRTQSYSSGVRSTESSGNAPSPGMLSPNNPVAPAPPLPKSPPPTLYRATAYGSNINNVGGHAPSPDRSPVTPPEVSPKARAERKTVSFNETVDTNEASEEEVNNGEKVREDPNRFFTEATAMLSSPRSPDGISGGIGINTPGVIGAQEVYRDPRTRRLAEQQQNKQAATPKPEKLSFKEKMKMFAMEAGEGESTPKEKPKVSKAQREIETTPGAAP